MTGVGIFIFRMDVFNLLDDLKTLNKVLIIKKKVILKPKSRKLIFNFYLFS